MDFTYDSYLNMIKNLRENEYRVVNYKTYRDFDKCVILRHDVDTSLEQALKLAEIESNEGIHSTFFFLLSADLYNIASRNSLKIIRRICDCGHVIGLHFDEVKYDFSMYNKEQRVFKIAEAIGDEIEIMSKILQMKIDVVSMHRPSKQLLEADLEIPEIINSYSRKFFKDFKYISDSRGKWREDINAIINANQFSKLHILTHGFLYHEDQQSIRQAIIEFVNQGNMYRYLSIKENVRDFDEIMKISEVR